MTVFPYPGDDPASLSSVSFSIDAVGENMGTFATSLNEVKGQLGKAWSGETAGKAQGDLGKLASMVPAIVKDLGAAKSALDVLAAGLRPIRSEVDSLRSQYLKWQGQLQGAESSADHPQRGGESAAAYESEQQDAANDEAAARRHMAQLEAEYKAQVTKANGLTETCQDALRQASSGSTHYSGSSLTTDSLATALGLGGTGFAVLHQQQMQQAATQFEAGLKGLNDNTLDPATRQQRMQALMQKYGIDASDPDFATAVANDLGQGYFQQLEQKIGGYEHFHGAQGNYYGTDAQFFTFNAQILAAATDTSAASHVDQKWIDGFFTSSGGVQPMDVMMAADYEKTGVPFPTSFLDATGKNAIWVETHFKTPGSMTYDWQSERIGLEQNGAFQEPYCGIPQSQDPLGTVMDQYANHPDVHSQLFTDNTDLSYLMHRPAWGEGGDKALVSTLDALTGPGQTDHRAAGAIAANVIDDLGSGKDVNGNGVAGFLRDPGAKIVGRYMDSILADPNGVPGASGVDGNTLLASGLKGEGGVAQLNLNKDELSSTLNWLYADTHDGTGPGSVRNTLMSAWAHASTGDLAQSVQAAQHEYQTNPDYDPGQPALMGKIGNSAQVLGLLTQSDINGYGDDQAAQAAAAAERQKLFDSVVGAIAVPEIPGAGPITSTAVDAGSDIVKGMLSDSLFGGPDPAAAAHNQADAVATATSALNATPSSVITALSHAGIPVISQFHDGQATAPTATVAAGTPDASLFTDPTTHRLLPYSQFANNQRAVNAYNAWAGSHSYFGDSSATRTSFTNGLYSSFYQGTLGAQPQGS